MTKYVLDDSEGILPHEDTCMFCKHLTAFRECAAFDEIPLQIWNGGRKHRRPYSNDRGIRFESKKDTDK